MTRFHRLTRQDLDTLSRRELLPRLEAEQAYWARKEARGLNPTEAAAREEFQELMWKVINPAQLATAMDEINNWLNDKRPRNTTYWTDTPGQDLPHTHHDTQRNGH